MEYDPTQHGRNSRMLGGAALKDDWRRAKAANSADSGRGEWVPVDAIWAREDLNPRQEPARDVATVERYADSFDQLPAIVVQKDTFALIDGRHRLDAARHAGRDLIRIAELDLPDTELVDQLTELEQLGSFDITRHAGRASRFRIKREPGEPTPIEAYRRGGLG